MFKNSDDLKRYIIESYPEVTDQRIDADHWDLQCTVCKITRGFQVIKREVAGRWSNPYGQSGKMFIEDFDAPKTYYFRCPVCAVFKIWIVFEPQFKHEDDGKFHTHYFRVTSLPAEGIEEIDELPNDPPALRNAYRQAIRAMDANAHLAAAAMFRRAVQVITRDLLGATPGNLANELKQVVGRSFNGTAVTSNFADVGYVVKEAGNQGAHPDQDPDLLYFTLQDAADLQRIFMELVSELFIIPAAAKKARADFLARRKISPSPTKP